MAVVLVLLIAVVVLVLLGWAILGLVFKLIWWALLGLAIGALARLVLPGKQAIGWLATIAAGVAGALLGGIIANALDVGTILQFVVAVAVAAALITVFGSRRRAYA